MNVGTSSSTLSTTSARVAASRRSPWTRLAVAGAAVASPLVLGALVLSARAGLSAFGVFLALSIVGAWAGCLTLPWRRRRGVVRASLALFLVTLALHGMSAHGNARVRVTTFPTHRPSLVATLVPERDPSVLTAAFLVMMQALPAVERAHMIATLSDGYERMLADVGYVSTPATMTWLGAQSRERFDVVEIDPPDQRAQPASPSLLVFLHGSAGNFTVECWQVAAAAGSLGWTTWCPSTSIDGDWADRERGAPIVYTTLREARAAGFERIVVAGLSAGARGLSFLAPALASSEVGVDGFIVISGAARTKRATAKPTLVIHGIHDALTPVSSARAYVQGTQAELLELDANHFVLLSHHERVTRAIAAFLERIPRKPSAGAL